MLCHSSCAGVHGERVATVRLLASVPSPGQRAPVLAFQATARALDPTATSSPRHARDTGPWQLLSDALSPLGQGLSVSLTGVSLVPARAGSHRHGPALGTNTADDETEVRDGKERHVF